MIDKASMSDSNFFSRLLRKNLWIYFFSFIIAPIGYVIKVVMTGTLSAEDYGVFAAVISFVMVLGAYNDFGMADSLNFFLPEYLHKKDQKKITQTFSIALVTQIVSSVFLGVFLFFLAGFLADHYFESSFAKPLLSVFIVFFFVDNVYRSINTFFQAIQDTKLQKFTDFLRNFSQVIFILGVAWSGYASITNYAWAYNLSAVFGVFFSLIFLVKKYKSYFVRSGWFFDKMEYKKIFQYAIFVMLSINVSVLLGQLDMQMITVMLGTTDAGFYNLYLSLIRIPFIFLMPGVYFLFPVFSDLIKRKDTKKIKTIHSFCYEFFSTAALVMTSFFILFGDVLTVTLFGPDYILAGRILLYSSPFLLFNFLLQIDFQILNASGRPRTKMFILLSAVGVNLITNFIFLKLWGIVGAAFASGIGWIYIWILSYRSTREYVSTFRWHVFLKNLIGISILSWLFSFVNLHSYFSSRLELFFGIILVLLGYTIVFVFLNISQFQRFLRLLRNQEITG